MGIKRYGIAYSVGHRQRLITAAAHDEGQLAPADGQLDGAVAVAAAQVSELRMQPADPDRLCLSGCAALTCTSFWFLQRFLSGCVTFMESVLFFPFMFLLKQKERPFCMMLLLTID